MGVETDLLLDNGPSYGSILVSHQPSTEFGGIYAKGLDHLNLLSLAAIVGGKPIPDVEDPEDAMSSFELVAATDDNFIGVWRVPSEVTANLRKIAESNRPELLATWSETPYFDLMDWDEELALEFLEELSDMLGHPDAKQTDLLMWISV